MLNYNFTPGLADISVHVVKPAERESEYANEHHESFTDWTTRRRLERNERIKRTELLYRDGMSVLEIAKDMGITKQTAYRYLRAVKDAKKATQNMSD